MPPRYARSDHATARSGRCERGLGQRGRLSRHRAVCGASHRPVVAEDGGGALPTRIKISDAELNALNLKQAQFHGYWNYALLPRRKK